MAHSWPFNPAYATSEFGPRDQFETPGGTPSSFHRGIDLAGRSGAVRGAPICASEAGTVIFAQYNGTAGNHVKIAHPYGKVTEYMHQIAIDIAVGTVVRKGQQIGRVGTTGASTGDHLHWGTLDQGVYWNPRDFMVSYGDGFIIGQTLPAGGGAVAIKEDEDMGLKLYEDVGGQGAPWAGKGALYVCGDGKARPVDPKVMNVRGIATAAFGAPIQLFSSDLAWVLAQYRDVPVAGSATISDAQIAALGAALAAAVADENDDLTEAKLQAALEQYVPTADENAAAYIARLKSAIAEG